MDIEFNSSGGTSIVTYAINCDGTVKFVSSDESWLHIEVESRRITITVDENEGQSGRTGTITPSVNGTDCPNKVINVRQKKKEVVIPCTSSVTINWGEFNGEIDACGGNVNVEIPYSAHTTYIGTNCPPDFDTELVSSFTVTVSANCSSAETRTITGEHYTIIQAVGPCDTCDCKEYIYRVYYPERLELDNCGTPERITITGDFNCVNPSGDTNGFTPNVTWSLSGNEEVYLRGEGNTATVSAKSNCDTSDISGKTATISLSAYTEQNEFISAITIPVVQLSGKCDSCEEPDTCNCESIRVTPITNNLPYTSGNNVKLADVKLADVNVDPDCINRFSFTSSNSNFINSIRINNGDIIGNVTENTTDSERTATISVKFDSATCPSFTVTQEAKPAEECPEYEITVTPEQLTCEGGYVKFGAKLNGTDVSGVENWTWECIGYTEGGSDPGDGRTNNELDINANDESYDITYTFKYTDSNGCTGTTTCSIAACDEEECEFVGKYGTVTGNCFCDGLTYDVWLTCNGNEVQGTRKRVITKWDIDNHKEWWDYGNDAYSAITKHDVIRYDGNDYTVDVPLSSECYVRQVRVELYAEQDDIAGGTINLNGLGDGEIKTYINEYGFDIDGEQEGDLSDGSSVSWNPTDQITVCDDGNTDYGLNIEFPATFYDVSIGEKNYTFTRNAVGKWACVKDETYDYIVLTPTIVVGRHGELIIRIRVQEGASL